MKKILLSLLGSAAMAMSANAMALDTTRTYNAFIDVGAITYPAGSLFFEFTFDEPLPGGGACQYVGQWVSPFPAPLTGQCTIREEVTTANFNCLANSLLPVPSVITIDTVNLPQPPAVIPPCTGFDYFGQFRTVALLVLGEGITPALEGVIQFAGPLGFIYGFNLV
jgi:hypothetical protein